MIWAADLEFNIVTELVKQVPQMVALIAVVWYFLRHIEKDAERKEKTEQIRTEAAKLLAENCHAFHEQSFDKSEACFLKVSQAIDNNSQALGKNSEVLSRATDVLSRATDPRIRKPPHS